MTIVWVLPLLGAVLGGFILIGAFVAANGAPQQAAGAAIAAACAILPYVFARSLEGMSRPPVAPTPVDGSHATPAQSPGAYSPTQRVLIALALVIGLAAVVACPLIPQ